MDFYILEENGSMNLNDESQTAYDKYEEVLREFNEMKATCRNMIKELKDKTSCQCYILIHMQYP